MQKPVRVIQIEDAIAHAAGISTDQLNSRTRERNIVDARSAVWFILRDQLHYPFLHIAKMYERDHTTVMSGVKRMRKMKASDRIIEGVKQVCPEAFQGLPGPGEPRSIDSWNFGKEKGE